MKKYFFIAILFFISLAAAQAVESYDAGGPMGPAKSAPQISVPDYIPPVSVPVYDSGGPMGPAKSAPSVPESQIPAQNQQVQTLEPIKTPSVQNKPAEQKQVAAPRKYVIIVKPSSFINSIRLFFSRLFSF